MANQETKKSINITRIVIALVVVGVVVIGLFILTNKGDYKNAKSADEIRISNSDSTELKVEKIQKKIEFLNREIDELQGKINPELEKLNSLYEEYINLTNQNRPSEPEVEETNSQESSEEGQIEEEE